MERTPEQLITQLATSAPEPIYCIAGPETLRVIEAADAVRSAARRHGCSEREIFEIAKSDDVWADIEATINAPSLFSPSRLIEIRMPSGKPGVKGAKFLEALAANVPSGVVVLILADDWSKKHGGKWSQNVQTNGVLSVAWSIKASELPNWLGTRLRSRQIQVDPEALRVLVDLVDGNLLAAAQEVEKLSLLTRGEPTTLDAAQMRAYVADLARFDVFRLTEAAWNGQGMQAIRILRGLQAEGVAVPALMGMLVLELRSTAALANALANGENLAGLFKSHFIWPNKQPMYRRALERHSAGRWQRFLVMAGQVDRASKGRASGDAWLHLQRLIAAIASQRAVRMLQTEMRAA